MGPKNYTSNSGQLADFGGCKMKRTHLLSSLAVAAATCMSAAKPVASVTSSSSFVLRGNVINTDGVPTWPIMAGDEIAANSGPVTVSFNDGSRMTLQQNSLARVESSKAGLVLRLMTGDMMVLSLPARPTVQIFSQSQPASVVAGQTVSAGSRPGARTPSTTNVVIPTYLSGPHPSKR